MNMKDLQEEMNEKRMKELREKEIRDGFLRRVKVLKGSEEGRRMVKNYSNIRKTS